MINKIAQIPKDKLLHFIAGMLSTAIVAMFPFMEYFGFVGAIIAGVGKEVWDKVSYGDFNLKDLLCTFLGGAVMQFAICIILL